MSILRSAGNPLNRFFSLLIQVRLCPGQEVTIPKCAYARGRGGGGRHQLTLPNNFKLSEISDQSQIDEEFMDPDEGEKARSFDDFYNTLGERGPSITELKKFAKEEREKLKLKILKRKYFKDLQETNLLTWETKEQIRFLHQEFPEDWTIDKLEESFPVSKQGIIKILNSSFLIKTPEKILKHDLKVKQKWKELEADISRKGGPINPQHKMLIESGKLQLLKNAATLNGVPRKVLHLEDGKGTLSKKPGIFSSILKDYVNEKNNQDETTIQTNQLELKKILKALNIGQKNFEPVTKNLKGGTSIMNSAGRPHEKQFVETPQTRRTMRRTLERDEMPIPNLSYLEAYQMKETGKVVNSENEDTNQKTDRNVFKERETRKYFKYSFQRHLRPASIMQSSKKMSSDSWDPSFQPRIKIPDHLKQKKAILYKKNDAYYDENGEILFRIPFNK